MSKIFPVILSGGSGTRLWPLSREHYPKQLLELTGPYTLLQETVKRLQGISGCSAPIVVCNEEHRFLVAQQLQQIGCAPRAMLLEPVGRNTAPALSLAALSMEDPEGILLVMPADHVIQDNAAFLAAVQKGYRAALSGQLVTFGVAPTRAETGYGYIQKGKQSVESGVFAVARFVEKPDAALAQTYLQSGEYLWNSGLFMMTAGRWLGELHRYRPDIATSVEVAWKNTTRDMDFIRIAKSDFEHCPSDSIDYAVMEKASDVVVVPLDAGWSDIGAWPALREVIKQDTCGNAIRGDVMVLDTHNGLVIAQNRFVAVVGLNDIIVVETADAVLVAHRDSAQKVKDIVAGLRQQNRTEHVTHRRVYRPWGHYEGVDVGERYQVKRITVNPGAALSLQMHRHRAEHWIVVKGTARVTRGDEVSVLGENQSTYIPIGTKHRLENPGTTPLEMIEVQSGGYLGEDDIVRFEDRYNRDNQT
jgi:mannose-1-phosphate guanylyltransferase/mannose-1-phosphate guanylyltransferase/mannose-6-phosphate isomerase